VDTAPLRGFYAANRTPGTLEELDRCCQQLVEAGIIDTVVKIPYDTDVQRQLYRKHLGRKNTHTHCYYGYPVYGSIFYLEQASTEYVVHFDCDMLLYQHPDFDWISNGARLLAEQRYLLSVAPLAGPPARAHHLSQIDHDQERYSRDPTGLYVFHDFTSRVFLVNVRRFEELLPLSLKLPLKQRLQAWNAGTSTLPLWEDMIAHRMKELRYARADLDSPEAWTLHPHDRSERFFKALPQLIRKVESGWYPPVQAGWYDIQLDAWLS
jgi:hypothetical protein